VCSTMTSSSSSPPSLSGEDLPLIPVGIDLGSLHARVSVGDPMIRSRISSREASASSSALSEPAIISNAQGSRFTLCLSVLEETHSESSSSSYVFGEAARRQLSRQKQSQEPCLVRRLCHTNTEAAAAFFSHLLGLACDAVHAARPSQLRVVLSVPTTTTAAARCCDGKEDDDIANNNKNDDDKILEALRLGVRMSMKERESKQFLKQKADRVVVALVYDAAAAVLAHNNNAAPTPQLPPSNNDNWKHCLVVDWGASGLTLSHIVRHYHHYSSLVYTQHSKDCAGSLLLSALVSHSASLLERKHRLAAGEVAANQRAVAKLTLVAETALKTLARSNTANLAADGVYDGLDLNATVSRVRLETMPGVKKVLRLAKELCVSAWQRVSSSLPAEEEQERVVVLVCGGVCQMPAAETMIKSVFGKVHSTVGTAMDESVAVGCGVLAQQWVRGQQEQTMEETTNTTTTTTSSPTYAAPLSPIGIAVRCGGGGDDNKEQQEDLIVVVEANATPLPAYVHQTLNGRKGGVVQILQTTTATNDEKVLVEIDDIKDEDATATATTMELTLELSVQGQLSVAVNGGETIVIGSG